MEKSTMADSWEEAAGDFLECWKCISYLIIQVWLYLCENKYYKYMKINFWDTDKISVLPTLYVSYALINLTKYFITSASGCFLPKA